MTKIEETKIDELIKEFKQFREIDQLYKSTVTKELEALKRGVYGDHDNDSPGLRVQVSNINSRLKKFENAKLKIIGFFVGLYLSTFVLFSKWDKIKEFF